MVNRMLLAAALLLVSESACAAQEAPAALAGKTATVVALEKLSSKLPDGTPFRLRLDAPLETEGNVLLAEGTLLEGRVKTVHARWFHRSGSLLLRIESVRLPDGAVFGTDASIISVDSKSVRADAEGVLHPRTSKKRLLLEAGESILVAKVADDLSEVIIGATAGSARYVGLGSGALFYLVEKGKNVKLAEGARMEVIFNRDLRPMEPKESKSVEAAAGDSGRPAPKDRELR